MKSIKMLILDVDGVLTDSRIYFSDEGHEMKAFNSKDGHGLRLLMRAGLDVAILTGRTSRAVEHRATDLGITHVIQAAKDKKQALLELATTVDVDPSEMVYMGDDLVDLPPMTLCGLSIAPADAVDEVKRRVDIVTKLPGGYGAVREAVEIILKRLGLYDTVMERYVV